MTRLEIDVNNPKTKKEKLIVKLLSELEKVTVDFVRQHNPGNLTQEMFLVLRDASLAYMGSMIYDLVSSLAHKEQVGLFLNECTDIFECYIEDIKKRYETRH